MIIFSRESNGFWVPSSMEIAIYSLISKVFPNHTWCTYAYLDVFIVTLCFCPQKWAARLPRLDDQLPYPRLATDISMEHPLAIIHCDL